MSPYFMSPYFKHVYFQRKNAKLQRIATLLNSTGVITDDLYLAVNDDVAKAGIYPALHYLTAGIHEGRPLGADDAIAGCCPFCLRKPYNEFGRI
jgi:hypothetical protein